MTPRGHHEHHSAEADVDVERAVSRVRARGGRVTKERRSILRVLAAQHEHLSADAIAARVRDDGIHRTTVFRALEAFATAGVVTHRQVPGGATEYHLVTPTHLHGHCSACGAVVALPTDAFDAAIEGVRQHAGFVVEPDRSVIGGLCRACFTRAERANR